MCDGQAASDCDIINLTEYESTLNDQLVKLDEHFNEIDKKLKIKKKAFVEMYRKDPRISHDEKIASLKQRIEDFNAMNDAKTKKENKQTIVCESFADDYPDAIVSSCKRRFKGLDDFNTYCFLNHPKVEKNQILRWSLRVPKFKYQIGMVITKNLVIFYNNIVIT